MPSYLDKVKNVDELDPLQQLGLIDVSYSRLNTLLDEKYGCDLKYFFNYIVKIRSSSGPAALLGNVIHQALEFSVKNDQELDEVTLYSEFEKALEQYDPDGTLIPQEMVSSGKIMVREYYDRHKKTKYSSTISLYPEILGNELAFEIVVAGGRIRGFIDLVYQLDDTVFIIDFKTGKNEVANYKVPTNTQLGIYALAMKKMFPDKTISASLYYLKSAKQKTHVFSDEDLEEMVGEIESQIKYLKTKKDFKPTSNEYTCRYCDYAQKAICPTGKSRLRSASGAY